jgi:type VI secretion system protein VasJ
MAEQLLDVEKITAALSTDQPCGESARYEPEYESLQEEVGKQDALTPQPVDWGQVVRASTTILEQKSKDVLIAAYLSNGLFEQHAYQGLAVGLKIFNKLVQDYWDSLFPELKRIRGRIAAVEWLVEKLSKGIERRKPVAADKEPLAEILQTLEQLGTALDEHLGDQSPSLSDVIRPLQGALQDIEKQTKAPEPAAVAPTTAAQGPVTVAVEQDVPKALRQCQQILRNVAGFLRGVKLDDPRPYRLIRVGTWIMVDQVPPIQNGVTQLAAVPAAIVQKYENYLTTNNYSALIPEVEESFSKAPFWLDAHRLTAIALDALGPSHMDARDAVIAELAHFVKRLPGLLEAKFSDGTPFASEQTRLWIDTEVLTAVEGGASPATGIGGGAETSPWVQAVQEAKKLGAKGKLPEAMALFTEGYNSSASQRERFFWRLHQATFCYDAGLVDVATPQLEHLDRIATQYSLEEWEPDLSLEIARVLLMCYAKSIEKNKKLAETLAGKMEDLYARVCRLDINAALAMDYQPAR